MNLKDYIEGNLNFSKTVHDFHKHHNCYASYTLTKSVDIRVRKQHAETYVLSEIGDASSETPKLTRSSLSKSNLEKCLICQKDKRMHDNRCQLKPVHTLTLPSGIERLRNATEILNGLKVLLHLSDGTSTGTDAITCSVLIHRSCHSSYMRSRKLKFLK